MCSIETHFLSYKPKMGATSAPIFVSSDFEKCVLAKRARGKSLVY